MTTATTAEPFAVAFVDANYRVRLAARYQRRDPAAAALRRIAARGQVGILVRIDPAGAIVVQKVVGSTRWMIETDPRTMFALRRAVTAQT